MTEFWLWTVSILLVTGLIQYFGPDPEDDDLTRPWPKYLDLRRKLMGLNCATLFGAIIMLILLAVMTGVQVLVHAKL